MQARRDTMKQKGSTVRPRTLAFALASVAACQPAQSATIRSASPGVVMGVPPSEVLGPYVPAGRQLTIQLDDRLSSADSVSGEPFAATAESTLLDTTGRTVVSPGDPIVGHVVGIQSGSHPQILLRFDAVQTRLGLAPLVATVLYVQKMRTPAARVERSLLSSPPTALPPEGVRITSPTGDGAVVLPRGTTMGIELTRGLFPPRTIVGTKGGGGPKH
jgi:hypothetical protein